MTVKNTFGDAVMYFLNRLLSALNSMAFEVRKNRNIIRIPAEDLPDWEFKTAITPFGVVNYNWNPRFDELHLIALRKCGTYAGTEIPYNIHVHPIVNTLLLEKNPSEEVQNILDFAKNFFKELFPDGSFNFEFNVEKSKDDLYYKLVFKHLDIVFGNEMYWCR